MRKHFVFLVLVTAVFMLLGCATGTPARPSTNKILNSYQEDTDTSGSGQTSQTARGAAIEDYMDREPNAAALGDDQDAEEEAGGYGTVEGEEDDASGEEEEEQEYEDEGEEDEGYDDEPWG
jgi:hypothetical protein